jgi:tRNA U34 5-methylaminomethyl-2-thiouridine-forming methyltransferase MnmC
MQRHIILTKDGSHTVAVPAIDATYHSVHGAVQESVHIFIEAGLKSIRPFETAGRVRIFEMGFGTGLNALLTFIEAGKMQYPVHYTALELFPLEKEEAALLNYCDQLGRNDLQPVFEQLHACEWEKEITITNYFTLQKRQTDLLNLVYRQALKPEPFHLIYFDAFAPAAQPELWTKDVFEKLYTAVLPGGILVTYCSKSDVRRAMQAAGFSIEKIPGPPGKREILRATKPID